MSIYNTKRKSSWGSTIKFWIQLLVIIGTVYLITSGSDSSKNVAVDTKKKKNVIFMVTDGMGPASLSLARSFKQFRDELPMDDILQLDKHLVGSSRTRSNSSLITDSAAGATAFSCGMKSYNGAIGVDSDKEPCGTVLEALKLQGYMTGLVVTTSITDATPAAFSSHVDYRFQEDQIAEQQLGDYPLGRMVDLIIGGGRCHFLPLSEQGGCRTDKRNLIKEAQHDGNWTYVGDREQFDKLEKGENVQLPLLGLLADTDIPYDIDRDPKEYPSLAEQTKVALTALSKATEDSDKGFFLLIEGSRIDHAGHHNDPATQVREVLAYDEAFKEVLKFIDNSDTETVAISTSDHETGGLVTSRQNSPSYPDYLWYPQVLLNSSHSGEYLSNKIVNFKSTELKMFEKFIIEEIIENDLGITDHTSEEVEMIKHFAKDKSNLLYVLNNMVSVRSQTGWTTHGHSAVDVNIYAYTNSESIKSKLLTNQAYEGLLGNHENIEIGSFMESITGVDLKKVSELIKKTKHAPVSGVKSSNMVDDMHQHAF